MLRDFTGRALALLHQAYGRYSIVRDVRAELTDRALQGRNRNILKEGK